MPSSLDASYGSVTVAAESNAPTCMSTIKLAVTVAIASGPFGVLFVVWLFVLVVCVFLFLFAVVGIVRDAVLIVVECERQRIGHAAAGARTSIDQRLRPAAHAADARLAFGADRRGVGARRTRHEGWRVTTGERQHDETPHRP